MIKLRFVDSVCRPFCSFFREGEKESETCGGVRFLDATFSPDWCANVEKTISPVRTAGREHDNILKPRLCNPCPFAAEDCDFRAGLDSPPCGGYVLLALALSKGSIADGDL